MTNQLYLTSHPIPCDGLEMILSQVDHGNFVAQDSDGQVVLRVHMVVDEGPW